MEYIINDFITATNNLPESYNSEPQRATVGAAWAMLGKAYMAAPEETGLRDFARAMNVLRLLLIWGDMNC